MTSLDNTNQNPRPTSSPDTERAPAPVGPRWRTALLAIGLASAVSVAIWALARAITGHELAVGFADQQSQTIDLAKVILIPALAGLLGWGLRAVLGRITARAATIWTVIAISVLLISFAGPLTGQTDSATRATLVTLHAAVGAILIAGLRSPAARRR